MPDEMLSCDLMTSNRGPWNLKLLTLITLRGRCSRLRSSVSRDPGASVHLMQAVSRLWSPVEAGSSSAVVGSKSVACSHRFPELKRLVCSVHRFFRRMSSPRERSDP
ncbi:hypothetical protein EVAR_50098_1 [Eumeta japonica]|uniref:Uncharacterized protein n=1 Tax=Eumeta variegata TaxID=151549 RepID=A0A4C1XWU1_EUMVA|nr:hypothetical protein EVAR_50098_1 [Eumeta japonica]